MHRAPTARNPRASVLALVGSILVALVGGLITVPPTFAVEPSDTEIGYTWIAQRDTWAEMPSGRVYMRSLGDNDYRFTYVHDYPTQGPLTCEGGSGSERIGQTYVVFSFGTPSNQFPEHTTLAYGGTVPVHAPQYSLGSVTLQTEWADGANPQSATEIAPGDELWVEVSLPDDIDVAEVVDDPWFATSSGIFNPEWRTQQHYCYNFRGSMDYDHTVRFAPTWSPGAEFRVDPVAGEPGTFWFHPDDTSGLHEWDFGDGTTDTGFQPQHTYERPGTYTVTHCRPSGDPDEPGACSTQTVEAVAPELTGAVTFWADEATDSSSRFALDEEFTVRLSVGAGDGVGALNGVLFDPTLDAVLDDAELLEVLEEPDNLPEDPTAPITLQPEESLRYEWRVKAARPGEFGVGTVVTAKDASDRELEPVEIGARGRIGQLVVEYVLPDDPIVLEPLPVGEDGDSAFEPARVPVTVRVTVPSSGDGEETGVPVHDITVREQTAGEYIDFDEVRLVKRGSEDVYVDLVPQPVPMPARIVELPEELTSEEVVQPGDSVEFDFVAEFEEPGAFEMTTIVQGLTVPETEGAGEQEITGSGSTVVPVGGEQLLQIEYTVADDSQESPQITEKETVYLYGTVRNLSPDQTIALDPLQFTNTGPGFVVGPTPFESTLTFPETPEAFAPTLAPSGQEGDEADFKFEVRTTQVEGIDGSVLVNWDQILTDVVTPTGTVTDEEGVERELAGTTEVLIDVDRGRVAPDGHEQARIGVTPAPHVPTRELGFTEFTFDVGGLFMKRATEGGYDKLKELPSMVRAMGPAMVRLGEAGYDFTATEVETYTQGALYMFEYYDYQSRLYLGMDTSTQEWLIEQTTDELWPLYQRQMGTRDALRDFVNRTVTAGFLKADEIYERWYDLAQYGWTYELAELYAEPGYVIGGAAVEEGVAAMTGTVFTTFGRRMMSSPRVLDDVVAAEARLAEDAVQQVDDAVAGVWNNGVDPRIDPDAQLTLRSLPGGTSLDPAQAIRGWAVDATSDQNLRILTSQSEGMPIIVAVRSRADETMQWMADGVGVELKPVTFKPKNVDWADAQFLGYRSGVGYGVGDRGATVLAEPLSRAEVLNRLEGATDLTTAQYAEVLQRHSDRWKEWYGVACPGLNYECVVPDVVSSKVSELKEIAATVQVGADGLVTRLGRLDVPSRGHVPEPADNWDTAGATTVYDSRRFEMRQIEDPAGLGREYYETWLEGHDGVMRRIAGDIDTVLVTDTSGRTLKGEMAERVGIEMQRKVGAQHPWSSTLSDPQLRNQFLDAHRWHPNLDDRGEPLLIYIGGEAKVGWFDPMRTIDPENPLDSVVWLDGGAVDAEKVLQFQRQSRGHEILDVPVTPGFKPAQVKVKEELAAADARNGGSTNLAATCRIAVNKGGAAVGGTAVYAGFRWSTAGGLQQRQPDGSWVAADAESSCEGGELAILPDVGILEDVLAGVTRIPVIDELFGDEWRALFDIGDCVTFEPGTPREESACIVDHGSIILDRPLRFAHAALSQVVLEPAGAVTPIAPVDPTDPTAPSDPEPASPSDPGQVGGDSSNASGAGSGGRGLAGTGSSAGEALPFAFVLMLAGLALALASRRRRRAE